MLMFKSNYNKDYKKYDKNQKNLYLNVKKSMIFYNHFNDFLYSNYDLFNQLLLFKKKTFNEIYDEVCAGCTILRFLQNELNKSFEFDNDDIKELKKMKDLLKQEDFFLHNNNLFEELKNCLAYINSQCDNKYESIENNLKLLKSKECLDLFKPLNLPGCKISFY